MHDWSLCPIAAVLALAVLRQRLIDPAWAAPSNKASKGESTKPDTSCRDAVLEEGQAGEGGHALRRAALTLALS